MRIPTLGDKFSSRHSQKGVIGSIRNQEDLPFCQSSGITPDIILNPHAIPSRQTHGHILEMLVGKACIKTDCTPFVKVDIEKVKERLLKSGFSPMGKEVMVSGVTGNIIEEEVYIGMIYYMPLRHYAIDKIRGRGKGSVSSFTGQPISGSSGSGLRIGEMEIDCLIAHGAFETLSSIYKTSDEIFIHICENCGTMLEKEECHMCGGITRRVSIPYSLKIFKQYMECIDIKLSFEIEQFSEQ
jgi:DNA-directed RNA polymerase beta subunit